MIEAAVFGFLAGALGGTIGAIIILFVWGDL